ncbi:MauE/DoxX family redox-associated membrane protein [Sphingobacterium hotanense]|uniref:Methylamine utilisation protein MauE domain-containing protein n=2 Tax=Sphingobacterium TaxID=28453 RepID=A0ABT7NNH2_9SPHI|nr:MauE/DoxX family redox-associated membrane protein [Sphingobacterium hotanense]MDM1048705.1 hypothetical protein [Sphingobacterium hotanense]
MKNNPLLQLCAMLLASMFFYAALVKLMDYELAQASMRKQVFPLPIADVLSWLIPVLELLTVLLLLFRPSQRLGLWSSFVLLIAFTVYIVIAMNGTFGDRPCSCGGILQHLSYPWHIAFNLLFLGISIVGLCLSRQIKQSAVQR